MLVFADSLRYMTGSEELLEDGPRGKPLASSFPLATDERRLVRSETHSLLSNLEVDLTEHIAPMAFVSNRRFESGLN